MYALEHLKDEASISIDGDSWLGDPHEDDYVEPALQVASSCRAAWLPIWGGLRLQRRACRREDPEPRELCNEGLKHAANAVWQKHLAFRAGGNAGTVFTSRMPAHLAFSDEVKYFLRRP